MSDDHLSELSGDDVMRLFAAANPVRDLDDPRRTPIPDWSEIETRHRVPAPAENPAGRGDDEIGRGRTHRVWLVAAAASLVVALVASIIAIRSGSGDGNAPADQPVIVAPEIGPDGEQSPPTLPTVENPEPADEAKFLDFAGPDLVAGERYASTFLGVDIEFTLPRDLFLATNRAGVIVMIDGFEDGTYSPDSGLAVDLRRWAGWSTREEAVLAEPAASIDPYDIDGWIAANDIVVSNDTTREIAGRSTRVLDVTVDPLSDVQAPVGFGGGCFPGWEPCFHMGAIASDDESTRVRGDWVSAKRITRLYVLPIEGSEPLLITVGAPPGSTWIDEIESTFIDSLVVGPDRPPLGG